jgi:hypothetical protein
MEVSSVVPKLSIEIQYDLWKRTATLVNTGEVRPFSEDKVFTVYVNEEFEIDKFVVLDPSQTLKGVHPTLAENFAAVTAARHEITLPTAGADAEDAAAQP